MHRHLLACALLCLLVHPAPVPAAATAPPVTLGETRPLETTLGDPALPTAQSAWVEMIRGARTSVNLEQFYLSHRAGEALQPILDELGRAAKRGVPVRLLLDAGMARTYPQPAESLVDARTCGHGQSKQDFIGSWRVGNAHLGGVEMAAHVTGLDVMQGHMQATAR